MNRLTVIAAAAVTVLLAMTSMASAAPRIAPLAVQDVQDDLLIQAKHGRGHHGHKHHGRGHHYGWHGGRGHHYGWHRGHRHHWGHRHHHRHWH